ncbi:MAG: DNA-processing protein DprA [Ilumatobacter fluminis]|uniref:DNA-processing protein DprA n=1 Tax=Ilumatobacter fluminis TaxID=467091 RepID=UPI0032EA91F0
MSTPRNPHDSGAVASLTRLPGVGSARLAALLRCHTPVDAFERLSSGRPLDHRLQRWFRPDLVASLRVAAREFDPVAEAERLESAGIHATWLGCDDYPALLAVDGAAPTTLFSLGSFDALAARRVAIIGTRNASTAGLATARELGCALADHDVTVVSGLARGIDGAAHGGVRSSSGAGKAVAVVGSGPDVVYPRRHRDLWWWIAEHGLLLSEWPPGTPPDAWRFPERNRIIAALCEVLVVVESRERGGSLITARDALDRDIEVMAVPGSPRVRASMGTNKLLVDGATPATCVDDVLVALGLDHRRAGVVPFDPRPTPVGAQAEVLRACEGEPCTLDVLVQRTGLDLTVAALAAARLEHDGWLVEVGGWFEPTRSHFASSPEQWIPGESA